MEKLKKIIREEILKVFENLKVNASVIRSATERLNIVKRAFKSNTEIVNKIDEILELIGKYK